MINVKLSDVVIEYKDSIKETKENMPIVGLEHLMSGEILLKKWDLNIENTFTKAFKKGHVLFGRRRAYLKKACYAEFDGVCSGDIIVIEAIPDKIVPELLPFIIQNEDLFDYAVGKSAGSLSPRVKWEVLKKYEFRLPAIDKQKEIARVLWSIVDTIETYKELKVKTHEMVMQYFNKKISNINTIGKLSEVLMYLKKSKLNANSAVSGGLYPLYVSSPEQNKRINYAQYDDECLLIGNGGVANVSYYKGKFSATSHMVICKSKNESKVRVKYIYLYLLNNINLLQDGFRGSGLQNISKNSIENIDIILPSIKEQDELISICNKSEKAIYDLEKSIYELQQTYKKLVGEYLHKEI